MAPFDLAAVDTVISGVLMMRSTGNKYLHIVAPVAMALGLFFLSGCESSSFAVTEVDVGSPDPALPFQIDEPVVDTSAVEPEAATPEWWKPLASQNLTWQWQLQGEVDTSFQVQVYNVDIDTPIEKITELKARDVKVICYFSAGTVEDFRPDASQFSSEIVGEQYEDLEDEKWLDYSNFRSFASVMEARMDECRLKGFDAIETDNVDAHNYETKDALGNVINIGTNFRITLDDSIAYIRWLAGQAHSRGLSIGLKNAEEMAVDVVSDVDWMLTEDCFVDSWCQSAVVFVENNKSVFMTEYEDLLADFAPACELAKSLGFSAIWRDPALALGTYLACE